MTGLHHAIWLPLSVFFYAMVMLYWVRVSIAGNRGADGFFSASHGLPPWLGALVTAGVSLTGWFVLGGTQLVARDGFTLPVLVSAGVLLALPGVIFFNIPDRIITQTQGVLFVMSKILKMIPIITKNAGGRAQPHKITTILEDSRHKVFLLEFGKTKRLCPGGIHLDQ